ncbi:UDP-3-O-[3-hydroxymyristoyl] N-acetylglucosamine deacetylase [Candidatus Sumerlaeota bacterium]|nr:UDP-3-O-[3-hydroxymyristoyl] N-acetylglucosamine deacetylase [Candidatus Sumerlaeota bacterium]
MKTESMVDTPQHTIARAIELSGAGLFSGRPCTMRLLPADPDSGIIFRRTDLPDRPEIPATVEYALPETMTRNMALGLNAETAILTTEHVLSACAGMGVDNLIIEANAAECPILDGSAKPVAEALHEAGLTAQDAERRVFAIREPVSYAQDSVQICGVPSETLKLTYFMHYAEPYNLKMEMTWDATPEAYLKQIAPARTYVFKRDAQALLDRGVIKGGDLEVAVVLEEGGNPINHVRFPDEAIRHKILDLLGDLMLISGELRGHIVASRSGHASHVEFVKKLKAAVFAQHSPEGVRDA